MKILLTGATGYIGKRLLPLLINEGHEVVCCVRDRKRFPSEGIYSHAAVSVLEVDFLQSLPPSEAIQDIEAAYYLIHSMNAGSGNFAALEEQSAENFLKFVEGTRIRQIIYLTGITNETELSKHLASRKNVEEILRSGDIPLTSIKAGIIVGSGSASFEIIRDLVEKLPVMITPKWLNTKSQPVAIRDVLKYLVGVLHREDTLNRSFDIGGPDVLTYKEMLLQFAEVRGFKRRIFTVPVMTPKLSSYWLYFVTSTSYKLAVNLVDSMKVEVIADANELGEKLNIEPTSYKEAVKLAFQKIEQNSVISSWKDALASSYADNSLLEHIHVPIDGCLIDKREKKITGEPDRVLQNIWSIGGKKGWYYGSWLWKVRGFMDKMVGGVGLRRGRTHPYQINTGDTLDFWRVLAADKQNRRLLLYAEMKLPGEAWLEFQIIERKSEYFLQQTATFRPEGLAGRLYWYTVLPFHFFVFEGMASNLLKHGSAAPGTPLSD
ncbi:SDR family oxidoreductase [Salinimicrobium oceani]|uniref:SDR family oxidoreductase n=1 Tax=Salinimicrobium oceani TaxID=2722702 RepID=A0ABX1CWC6_9FLAO|nr:SDR family oxidoreductase [Salinimicrobium oceani]NJW52596.1 SDR family oxidoreductase [Salinimicrobium oceani]